MTPFHALFDSIKSSVYHNQMIRFVAPLYEYLGINHFWYYKITNTGDYSYFGTHSAWIEYCFDQAMVKQFPCIRHPNLIQAGIGLMKATDDMEYKQVLETAWDKFKINFNLNLVEKVSDGIEAFGFATRFNDPKAEERLINELPLLRTFTKIFRQKHQKLFNLLEENQVNLSEQFGAKFYECPKQLAFPDKRDLLLQKLGLSEFLSLTSREIVVLKYVVHGFPAGYIAKQLHLSTRTVENYLANLKDKLGCTTKADLIMKAMEIDALGVLGKPFVNNVTY
ncbi:MAG: helix-turn-helix transcriptional regulator [Parachlamydiaceae bacterium]|nr:helix-turn-helix transcriptional regulator [Parachlamydiaceae bacterium]